MPVVIVVDSTHISECSLPMEKLCHKCGKLNNFASVCRACNTLYQLSVCEPSQPLNSEHNAVHYVKDDGPVYIQQPRLVKVMSQQHISMYTHVTPSHHKAVPSHRYACF